MTTSNLDAMPNSKNLTDLRPAGKTVLCIPSRDRLTTEWMMSTRAEEAPADAQLAAALRRILQWVVGAKSAGSMFEHSKTLAVRIFILARCLRINDCDRPTLAEVAGIAGYSRAALSKVAVQMRDQFGVPNITPQSREAHRGTARQAALHSWERRKKRAEG